VQQKPMDHLPFEPHPSGPFEFGPMVRLRRGEGYWLPPAFGVRHCDGRHFRDQDNLGWMFVLGMVALAIHFLGRDFGWW